MKIGVIFCAYNCENYVNESLAPFIADERFVISAVSVPFLEYRDEKIEEDSTIEFLEDCVNHNCIKYLTKSPRFIKEHEARNLALDKLKREKCDFIMMVDGDEFYEEEDLDKIVDYISSDLDSFWWKICLKNFVFDTETYLEEPFCPPRIFRVKTEELSHPTFYGDNDVSYLNKLGQRVSYLELPNKTVPKEMSWIAHYSWLNNAASMNKVKYQKDRWGENGCCFDWVDGKLIFSEKYFASISKKIPSTLTV